MSCRKAVAPLERWGASRVRRYLPFSQAKERLLDADLLFYHFSTRSLISRAISVFGRSPYAHVAMVGFLDGHPWRLEVREWYGGRHDPLEVDVEKYSGKIDVFRPAPIFYTVSQDGELELHMLDRRAVVDVMIDISRPGEYGYRGVLLAGLTHMPVVRWFLQLTTDDQLEKKWPPFCSQACAYAFRKAYVDPVPFLPDYRTEPGDLARSPILANYLFTLVSDKDERAYVSQEET